MKKLRLLHAFRPNVQLKIYKILIIDKCEMLMMFTCGFASYAIVIFFRPHV